MALSLKFKRNLSRILPFGFIWFLTSWVFLISDLSLTRNQNINPDTDITLTLPVIIFGNITMVLFGLLIGAFEMVVLEKRFRNYSSGRKIIYKLGLYLVMCLLIISIAYPIAASIESNTTILNPEIWKKLLRFFTSYTSLNTIIQLGFAIFLSVIYAAISENLGHVVLRNLLTGKYHSPIIEKRVFMFLDMNDSTTIAEKLGHVVYFQLLREYYELMSDPIINHSGEVYQYIGDEVVISWKEEQGFIHNNCIRCFEEIKTNLQKHSTKFIKNFGVAPDFKAGIHVGEVTTGEIGALKKEIVFTGDVLNTTSRIQSLCKEFNTDLIISEDVYSNIESKDKLSAKPLGSVPLKGKIQLPKLFSVG